jgi:drug/metabolite transporter (DMT)-like permease
LAAVTVCGGIAGPLLMFSGLQRVSGIAGALLLNLEAVFTMLIALLLFREHLAATEALAAVLIVLGAALLGFRAGAIRADWLGIVAIAGACLSWGLDNNLTQRLSLRDPTSVARVKTLGAGTCTLAIALATGQQLPRPGILLVALVIGALSYGLSIVFDVYALRYLGAAREAAFFAVAPFAGAALALPLLKEHPASVDYLAAALMATGVVILVRAGHSHLHSHRELFHEHEHVHDEHHQHEHQGLVAEPHSHLHRHLPLEHEHPHVSDSHHRHPHKGR